jgi:hypothetical protein
MAPPAFGPGRRWERALDRVRTASPGVLVALWVLAMAVLACIALLASGAL